MPMAMVSLNVYCQFPLTKALQISPRNPKFLPFTISTIPRASSSSAANPQEPIRTNYAGVHLKDTVDETKQGKLRLDSWISSRIHGISRGRVQSSIKSGLVTVNGRVVDKVKFNSILLLLQKIIHFFFMFVF